MKPYCNVLLSFVRRYYTINNQFIHETPIKKLPENIDSKPIIPKVSKAPRIKWTNQQLQIIDAVERGESVFVTGSAGTGKTVLMQHIIKKLRKIHGKNNVFVTASTGVAACALKGQTLQSFAGVGLGEEDAETLLSKVLFNWRTFNRWEQAKALVIDEVSMIPKTLFDKIEYIASRIRSRGEDCDENWGGIQLVVSGDFLQLAPICKKYGGEEFAFEAESWDRTFKFQFELNEVFRQSELEHVRLLQGIRRGELDEEGVKILQERSCGEEPDDTVVRLFPRVRDVERVNNMRLKGLGEDIIVYIAYDTGQDPWKRQLENGIAPTKLELCKGARVMLIKNLNVKHKLVNGATGTIRGLIRASKGGIVNLCSSDVEMLLPIVKFDSGRVEVIEPDKWEVTEGGKVLAKRLQLPLMLAWAMSIHKSQGMTLDRLHTDLSQAFGCGMVYVALSRLRSLDGLSLSGFSPSKIKAHPKVLEYYQKNFL